MNERIVDPTKFLLLGGITDWVAVSRSDPDHARPAAQIARERGLDSGRLVQLRWVSDPAIGFPSAPYTVWRRGAGQRQGELGVEYSVREFFGWRLYTLDRPYVFVRLALTFNAPGTVSAWAAAPLESKLVGQTAVSSSGTYTFSGPRVQTVLVSSGIDVGPIFGLDDSIAEAGDWKPVEIVGLPFEQGSWAGVLDHDQPQGPVDALTDPVSAALDRYRRGAPFFGWATQLAAGVPAPAWQSADPKAIIGVTQKSVLPALRDMLLNLDAVDHASYQVSHTLASQTGTNPVTAQFNPLKTLVYGASTDGLASLITGFGTAFTAESARRDVSNGGSAWDYMVTAPYEKGTLGSAGDPVEYAAILFAPGPLEAPPAAVNLTAAADGMRSPDSTDDPWTAITRIGWDKLPDTRPFQVSAYAFARQTQVPAAGIEALMDARLNDDALQPLGVTISSVPAGAAPSNRYSALDDRYAVDASADPNVLLYGIAQLNLFGLYGPWASIPFSVTEPPAARVTLVAGRYDVTGATPGLPCPATLTIDFSYNWASRSPDRIEFVGRHYGQNHLGDPPADLSVPGGLPGSLAAGAGIPLTVDFDPDGTGMITAVSPGLSARLYHLSLDGKTIEPSPVSVAQPRRYRIVVSGFSLDFGAAGRLGTALWARAREARSPGRVGAYGSAPLVVSTADPRPPVIVNDREFVQLTSLGDASGEHHALLEWAAAAGAVSYFVYSVAESKFLSDRGLPEPRRSLTLADRLVRLRDAFQADPDRRSFSRVNATPVTEPRLELTLPRGTKEIHLCVVLGLSAGQIESEWPTPGSAGLRNRFVAFAAPQVVVPNPPDLEVERFLDESVAPPAFRARVRLRTSPGAPVVRVDLHRVRVPGAAVDLDSMGPPIARLSGTTAPFSVTPTVSDEIGVGQAIGTVRGLDPVPGSWRSVYYRAVAWSGDDAERGLYGGRSLPSTVRKLVVPPTAPPDLSALVALPIGGGQTDVRIDFRTGAPVDETPLGPHRVSAEVLATHDDGTVETLYRYPPEPVPPAVYDPTAERLDALSPVAPAAGVAGMWRDDTDPTGTTPLHLVVRRASFADPLSVRVRLTDPLGRLTEQTLVVDAGVAVPAPDILNPRVFMTLGRGSILSFTTTVPDTDASGRSYRLQLGVTSALRFPPLPPLSFAADLASIATENLFENLRTSAESLPVRRTAVPGGTQISALLRRRGRVFITLTAPDGTVATHIEDY